ncbi:protein phosphatase 2C domain-containing protein [Actinoplanes subglobosus]|uniref:Protein phosphatase 2C domain-containing protein n=1 Tax=Actinoplanes subglobosus TaxID=1547892 RepID=A0ABV8IN74_9ACTN
MPNVVQRLIGWFFYRDEEDEARRRTWQPPGPSSDGYPQENRGNVYGGQQRVTREGVHDVQPDQQRAPVIEDRGRTPEQQVPADPPAPSPRRKAPPAPPPDPTPWDPPVVGRPIPWFRPKPPNAEAYRPDYVADGWSTPHFTIRVASARGYAHRYTGDPRQDDVAVAWHRPTGAVLFAVADGVGNAPLSHIGATSACRAAIGYMTAGLNSPEEAVDWSELLQSAAWQVCEQARISLGLSRIDKAAAEEQMATTLVAGCVMPEADGAKVTFVQAGDSSAWMLNPRERRYRCLAPTKYRRGEEVVSNAVVALPRVPSNSVRSGSVLPGEILLVGTDGFGDALGDGENAVGDHFVRTLSEVPPVLKFANDLDFSFETWDDDRTLFALWPHHPAGR